MNSESKRAVAADHGSLREPLRLKTD